MKKRLLPQPFPCNENTKAVQVGVVSYKQEQSIRKLEIENALLKEQNDIMQQQINEQKLKARSLLEEISSPEFKQMEEIQNAASGGNIKAHFLLEQINNYDKKTPSWSASSLQLCTKWQEVSGKGYSHVRKKHFITCPSRSTLERFARDEEIGIESEIQNISEVTIEIHPVLIE